MTLSPHPEDRASLTASPPAPSLRPALSPLALKLLVTAFLLATANATFWDRFTSLMGDRPLMIAGGGVIAYAAILFCISVFTLPGLVRPVLAMSLVLGAVASHFQDRLGVVIDRDMLQNAANTTGNESRHLMTPAFFLHLTLYGLIPAGLVLAVRPRRLSWWRHLLHYPVAIILALALFVGAVMTDYKGFSSMLRERREISSALIPATAIVGGVRFAKLKLVTRNLVAEPIGEDARKGPRIAAAGKPTLTLIVVGETARAANWSLGTYDRPTNPELARRDIVYADKVRSCGTSTAVSMPCMFAHYGMDNHSQTMSRSYQNLLDVYARAGFDVQWYDNNTGHLGIADRVSSTMFKAQDKSKACEHGECTDEVFLPKLDEILGSITKDTVIVYHQIGSHGPAYYLRYPQDKAPFQPDCRSADFGKCTPEEITNAYDNTIAFTDWFLAQAIDRMAAQDRVIASMFYVSDHGESLGENGIYLHATPYFMAPDVQTQVPLVIWTSPDYRSVFGLDWACVKQRSLAGELTHDVMFHTLLGLADVQTELRKPELDLTDGCHG